MLALQITELRAMIFPEARPGHEMLMEIIGFSTWSLVTAENESGAMLLKCMISFRPCFDYVIEHSCVYRNAR